MRPKDTTIEKWYSIQRELKNLKEQEMELRKQICSDMFSGNVGEFSVEEEYENFVVTAKSQVIRSLDQTALNTMLNDLTDHERECIKFEAKLVLRPYRSLPEDSVLHDVVTEKPAAPTLKVDFKPQ